MSPMISARPALARGSRGTTTWAGVVKGAQRSAVTVTFWRMGAASQWHAIRDHGWALQRVRKAAAARDYLALCVANGMEAVDVPGMDRCVPMLRFWPTLQQFWPTLQHTSLEAHHSCLILPSRNCFFFAELQRAFERGVVARGAVTDRGAAESLRKQMRYRICLERDAVLKRGGYTDVLDNLAEVQGGAAKVAMRARARERRRSCRTTATRVLGQGTQA